MIRLVFLASIPFGAVGFIACFWLHEVTAYMSSETVFGVKHNEAEAKEVFKEEDNAVHLEKSGSKTN